MSLDTVHDIQSVYRNVLNSLSRPGVIADLSEQANKLDLQADCYPSTLMLALMLLDTEVTFAVVAEHAVAEQVTRLINQLTYAKAVEQDQADVVFVLTGAEPRQFERALEQAKTGSLIDPHESATIIVEADAVSPDPRLLLKGPGIRAENAAHVVRSGDWLPIREQKNAEFPMGIDLIFIDGQHQLVCLPRTTQIAEQVMG